jgi:hypothetical protein
MSPYSHHETSTLSLTSVLGGGGEWSTTRPGRFTPKQQPDIH